MRKIISQAYLLLEKQKFWGKINVQDPISLIQEHSIIIISSTSISVSDSFLIIFQMIFIDNTGLIRSYEASKIKGFISKYEWIVGAYVFSILFYQENKSKFAALNGLFTLDAVYFLNLEKAMEWFIL